MLYRQLKIVPEDSARVGLLELYDTLIDMVWNQIRFVATFPYWQLAWLPPLTELINIFVVELLQK